MANPLQTLLSGFGFFSGVRYPLRALCLFRREPRLWGYLIIPVLLNLVLGGILYWQLFRVSNYGSAVLQDYIQSGAQQVSLYFPQALQGLNTLVQGLVILIQWGLRLLGFIVTGFILAQVGVFLGAPWYGKLSETLERLTLGSVYNQEIGFLGEIQRAIAFELKKLTLLVGIGVICLGLNLLPGLGNLVASILGLSLTTVLTCLDLLDPALERRRFKFRTKLGMIARSFPASAGFGLTCLGLVSIPLLNIVTLPLCVAAGTLFFCERLAKL